MLKVEKMDSKLKMSDIMRYRSEQLCASLGIPNCHPATKGDLTENQWIDFLKGFLPNRYDVSRGFVFDSRGGVSDQIDIIVFDPFHSPLIYDASNGEKYVTAESVYAVFEVKQSADKGNLEYAQEKVETVKNLHRTSRRMISSGNPMKARDLPKIIGGLLTTDSISPETVKAHMQNCSHVDILCAAKSGTFHQRKDRVENSSPEEALFSFFYLLLDELFKLGTVGAIDIRDYADGALKTFTLERGVL